MKSKKAPGERFTRNIFPFNRYSFLLFVELSIRTWSENKRESTDTSLSGFLGREAIYKTEKLLQGEKGRERKMITWH